MKGFTITKVSSKVQTLHQKTKGTLPSGILVAILLLAFLLRVNGLSNQSLWYDELATWNRAILPFSDMIDDLLMNRKHLPTYFIIMRIWALLGDSELILRYFSVVSGTIAVAAIYLLGKQIDGRKLGLISALFLSISPFHIWYSQEARMYALTGTLVLLATYFFVRLLRRDRWLEWIGYVLMMVLAVYSHYLALFILAAHYAFLALHYRRLKMFFRKWIAAAAAICLMFAIWGAYIMLTGGLGGAPFWIQSARWYEPLMTLLVFSAGPTISPNNPLFYVILAVFFLAAGIAYRRYGWRLPQDQADQKRFQQALKARLLVFWLFVPVLLVFLISLDLPIPQKRSIYMDRYLLFALPGLLLLSAWGLLTIAHKPSKRWILVVAIGLALLVSAVTLRNLYSNPEFARDNWRQALASVDAQARTDDVILGRPDHSLPLAYYTSQNTDFTEIPAAPDDPTLQQAFGEEMAIRLALAGDEKKRAWLVTNFYNNDPHGFPQERNRRVAQANIESPQKAWMDDRYPKIEQWQFPGIYLTLYDLESRVEQ